MGRGSKQQRQQGGAGSSAVTAAAAAADPIPDDEPVWRLLLGELWQAPEQKLVCRLLCCSRAMARLVHERCAGRVVVHAKRQAQRSAPQWRQQAAAQGEAYSTWFTKNARLLAALRLELWDEQEHVVTGLVAAAQPQPLLLRSLALDTSSRGSTGGSGMRLPSLAAACPQLTRLLLKGCVVAEGQQQQLATAFTALRHLRELSWQPRQVMALPALQLPTQLTKLRLSDALLSAEACSSLPASLVDLAYQLYSALPAAGHLTALTRLECYKLDAGSSVPASVEQLQLSYCNNAAPLHHLTRLRSLDCTFMACSVQQLQAAVVAIGPSLTALDVGVVFDRDLAGLLSQRVSGPSLPLTGLKVDSVYGSMSVAQLGQWTGLTRLELSRASLRDTPQQVAQQLGHLTALQELSLCRVSFSGAPQRAWQPVIECVVGMSTLRGLRWELHVFDEQQHAQLQGMTQLTALVV